MSQIQKSCLNSFFIIGPGRSGSTLLRMILSEHSKITIPPETWYLLPLLEKLPHRSRLTTEQVIMAVDIMINHYRWPDLNIGSDIFKQQVLTISSPTLREIVDVVYQHKLAEENKEIWGDKTPPYVRIIPQLHQLYPDAKFLYLVRDGRDVAKSFQSKGWYGPWMYQNTKEWRISVQHYLKSESFGSSIKIMSVWYEDIVLDMETTVRGICEFLEIDFEPSMLNWESNVEKKVPKREAYAHKKLFRKPLPSDVYRWKKELTKLEVFIIESFNHRELLLSGYELYFHHFLWKPLFFAVRMFCVLAMPLYIFSRRVIIFVWKRVKKLIKVSS